MKHNNLKVILSIFTLLLTISIYAQGPPGGGGRGQKGGRGQERGNKPDASEILSKLDINSDGVIDKEEALKDERGNINDNFDEIDSNEDEVIDLDELKESINTKGPRKVSAKKIIKQIDDNEDGTLNELEVAAKGKLDISNNFSKIDTNQDGELDLHELKLFYSEGKKEKRKKRD